jgi:hypothetical protein
MQLLTFLPLAGIAAIAAAEPAAAVTTTAGPHSNPACSSLRAIADSCRAATTSFTALRPDTQASCLCGGSSDWDSAAQGCYSWAQASDSSLANSLSGIGAVGLCTNLAAVSTDLGPILSSAVAAQSSALHNPACHSLDDIVRSCAKATPSFTALRGDVQVSCLCGGDTGWDAAARSCYQWARASDTGLASALTAIKAVGACAGAAHAAATTATTTATAMGSTAAAATTASAQASSTGSSTASSTATSSSSAAVAAKVPSGLEVSTNPSSRANYSS